MYHKLAKGAIMYNKMRKKLLISIGVFTEYHYKIIEYLLKKRKNNEMECTSEQSAAISFKEK